jgi:hypothetical protein
VYAARQARLERLQREGMLSEAELFSLEVFSLVAHPPLPLRSTRRTQCVVSQGGVGSCLFTPEIQCQSRGAQMCLTWRSGVHQDIVADYVELQSSTPGVLTADVV